MAWSNYKLLKRTLNSRLASFLAILANNFAPLSKALCFKQVPFGFGVCSLVSKLSFWTCFLLLALYALVGVILSSGFNGLYNEPYYAGFKYITIPTSILIVFFYFYRIKTERTRNQNLDVSLGLLLMFTIFSSGYLGLLNKKIGNQQEVIVAGLIVDTDAVKQRRTANYYVKIRLKDGGEVIKFEVKNYVVLQKYQTGAEYNEVWYQGFFGLIYR